MGLMQEGGQRRGCGLGTFMLEIVSGFQADKNVRNHALGDDRHCTLESALIHLPSPKTMMLCAQSTYNLSRRFLGRKIGQDGLIDRDRTTRSSQLTAPFSHQAPHHLYCTTGHFPVYHDPFSPFC